MTLDGLIFDHSTFSPFVVEFLRAKASVRPHISDVVLMHELVKGNVFEFIGRKLMKKWKVLCESHQDWF